MLLSQYCQIIVPSLFALSLFWLLSSLSFASTIVYFSSPPPPYSSNFFYHFYFFSFYNFLLHRLLFFKFFSFLSSYFLFLPPFSFFVFFFIFFRIQEFDWWGGGGKRFCGRTHTAGVQGPVKDPGSSQGLRCSLVLSIIWALYLSIMIQHGIQKIPGDPPKKRNSRYNRFFSGLCSDQQLSVFTLLDRASFPHY